MAYIEFCEVDKFFGENQVLKKIDLTIEKGQFVTLLGPSGCGKSTLLRSFAGLEQINRGKILLDGVDITNQSPKERNIGMVFQQYSLFPNMTVAENIAFGLKMQKKTKSEIEKEVRSVIQMVELNGKENQYPASLSGGQQQRVALARSIATRPKVLLFDEPFSAIDAKLRKALQKRIKDIHKELGLTCIFVTHDQDEAMIMSDVIHLFNQGRIEQSGAPNEIYTSPRTRYAAGFIGNYNIFTASEFAKIVELGVQPQKDIAIRPETVEISPTPFPEKEDSYRFEAIIREHTSHGNVLRYTLETKGESLKAEVMFRSAQLFSEGSKVFVHIEKRNCLAVD